MVRDVLGLEFTWWVAAHISGTHARASGYEELIGTHFTNFRKARSSHSPDGSEVTHHHPLIPCFTTLEWGDLIALKPLSCRSILIQSKRVSGAKSNVFCFAFPFIYLSIYVFFFGHLCISFFLVFFNENNNMQK